MLHIKPFKGLLYNPEKFDQYEDVLVPPYDVITSSEKKEFQKKSPYNFANLSLGPSYEEIAKTFKRWTEQRVFISNSEPHIYFCRETFNYNGLKERLGVLCLVKQGNDIIPHERTFLKYRKDRLQVTEATHAQISPIFAMFHHKEALLKEYYNVSLKMKKAKIHFQKDDYTFELWPVSDAQFVSLLNEKLYEKKIYIIDGHHRYAVMEEYHKIHGSKDPYVMMHLTNQDEGGLFVLPTHRAVKFSDKSFFENVLQKNFKLSEFSAKEGIEYIKSQQSLIGVTRKSNKDKFYILDVESGISSKFDAPSHIRYLMDEVLIESQVDKVHFIRGLEQYETSALKDVESNDFDAVFWISPVTWNEFFQVTDAGSVMPQKSTYFYPKILSGTVIYPL